MKLKKKVIQEVEVKWIVLDLPVYYGEEDIPNDFPLRVGDRWVAQVSIDSGKIEDWPVGRAAELDLKVTDGGTYTLLGVTGDIIAEREEEYVPQCVPGSWGDYVSLKIDATGRITNWPKNPDMSDFEKGDE